MTLPAPDGTFPDMSAGIRPLCCGSGFRSFCATRSESMASIPSRPACRVLDYRLVELMISLDAEAPDLRRTRKIILRKASPEMSCPRA